MKKMTCKQMGGPCDEEMMANDAQTMMKMGGDHVNKMVEMGDEDHKAAKQMMDDAANDPEALKAWQDDFMTKWNATPDEAEDAMAPAAE